MRASIGALVVAAAVAIPAPALAIPAFARRYQVDCVMCHEGFPKLNGFGQRFKERGFRLEHEDAFAVGTWVRSVPVVLRGSLTRSFVEDRKGVTSAFGKFVSAGNWGRRLSYWVDDGVSISGGDVIHTRPDNTWLRVEVVPDGKLYVRGGRMELDLPFTQARTPHLFGYDIYSANTGLEVDFIGQHKEGAEIGGDLPGDAHWSAALVKGHRDAASGGFNPAFFLRLAKRLGRQRLGAYAYAGRSSLSLVPAAAWDDHVLRLGADANLWIERLNLYGLVAYGRNDNPEATAAQPTGTRDPSSFSGGFAQADYHVKGWLALTLRMNVVSQPLAENGERETFSSLLPGIQVFIVEHGKLSFEYGFQNRGRPQVGAVQAEFAF